MSEIYNLPIAPIVPFENLGAPSANGVMLYNGTRWITTVSAGGGMSTIQESYNMSSPVELVTDQYNQAFTIKTGESGLSSLLDIQNATGDIVTRLLSDGSLVLTGKKIMAPGLNWILPDSSGTLATEAVVADLIDLNNTNLHNTYVEYTTLTNTVDAMATTINTSVAATLNNYVTNTALTTAVSGLITTDSLAMELDSYASKMFLNDRLATYVSITGMNMILASYVTNVDFTGLAGTVVPANTIAYMISDALIPYATTQAINTTLEGYVTTDVLGTLMAPYITEATVAATYTPLQTYNTFVERTVDTLFFYNPDMAMGGSSTTGETSGHKVFVRTDRKGTCINCVMRIQRDGGIHFNVLALNTAGPCNQVICTLPTNCRPATIQYSTSVCVNNNSATSNALAGPMFAINPDGKITWYQQFNFGLNSVTTIQTSIEEITFNIGFDTAGVVFNFDGIV